MAKDFFKNKKGRAVERTSGKRGDPKPDAILIVSEGTKTEPFYFQGLVDYINAKCGENVTNKPLIFPEGIGRSTMKLIQETNKLVARGKRHYSQVWVVFDKDDFTDFDEAIRVGKEKGYQVAWNNKSFEYWIFLHFNYSDAALNQDGWTTKIGDIFRRKQIDASGYRKCDPKVFDIATKHGSLKQAIQRAKRIEDNYPQSMVPSQCNPCTKVYQLIESLAPYIPELLE